MKRNGFLFSVVLLVLAGIVMTGCQNGNNDPPSPAKYTVTFDKNCEEEDVTGMPAAKTILSGFKITKPDDPSKPDKDFGGWFKDAECTSTNVWDFLNDTVTEDITLYAKWTDKAEFGPPTGYDAVELGNFNWSNTGNNALTQQGWGPNGLEGVVSNVKIEDFIQAQYLWIWVKNNPGRGMQINWQGDFEPDGLGAWIQSEVLDSGGGAKQNVVKTAEQGGYSIKIDLANVLGKTVSNKSFTDAKAGIRFILGYFTGDTPETGLTKLGEMKAYLLLPTGTITARTYKTVTFNTDGGTPATISDIEVMTGYPLGAKYPEDPTKTDNVFDGWKDATSVEYTKYTPITAITALNAQWLVECTVTFDFQGGGTNVDVIVGEGKALKTSDIPTPGAHPTQANTTFEGWYNEATCTTLFDPSAFITADKTYYAKWVKSVTVKFDLDGGVLADGVTTITEMVIPAGLAIGAAAFPASPARIGHTFGGWKSTDATDTTVYDATTEINADVDLEAKWTKTATYLLELGPMDVSNGTDGKQNGWLFGGTEGADITNIEQAKFLVIKIDGKVNTNPWGIGGASIIYQVGGSGWDQHTISDPAGGWAGLNFQNEIIYFVIDLEKVVTTDKKDWSDVVSSADGTKLLIQTWMALNDSTGAAPENLGYSNAYLIDDISGTTTKDLELELDVYITRDNLGF